eukprot:2965900-Rhodomonas_salina.1
MRHGVQIIKQRARSWLAVLLCPQHTSDHRLEQKWEVRAIIRTEGMDPFGAQSLNGDGTAAPDILRAGETALTSVDLSQATQALSEARLPGAEDLASGSLSQAQSVLDNTSDPRAKEPRTNYRTETDGDERRQETRSPQSTSQRATGQHQTSSPQRSRASKEPENTQKRNSSSSPSKQ